MKSYQSCWYAPSQWFLHECTCARYLQVQCPEINPCSHWCGENERISIIHTCEHRLNYEWCSNLHTSVFIWSFSAPDTHHSTAYQTIHYQQDRSSRRWVGQTKVDFTHRRANSWKGNNIATWWTTYEISRLITVSRSSSPNLIETTHDTKMHP